VKNRQVKQMIADCITASYGYHVAEWRRGELMQFGWNRPFRQGVISWFGSVKDIK
jgi:hypothetical protein